MTIFLAIKESFRIACEEMEHAVKGFQNVSKCMYSVGISNWKSRQL